MGFKHTERRITRRKPKTETNKSKARNIARQMDIGRDHRRTERSGVQVGRAERRTETESINFV